MKKKVLVLIAIIVIVIIVRIFVIEPYKITSGSMLPTIEVSNWILISKLAYGPRIPNSFESIPFGLVAKWIFHLKGSEDWSFAGYHRTSMGYIPKRYDIVLLKNPSNLLGVYCKRIIGLPGDSITISHDSLFIHNRGLSGKIDQLFLKSIRTTVPDSLKTIFIPASSTTVNLIKNPAYYSLIKKFEEPRLKRKGELFFIGGKETVSYPFKMNYYFVMGDNRNNSKDSRFFGLVPESCIIGKAVLDINALTFL